MVTGMFTCMSGAHGISHSTLIWYEQLATTPVVDGGIDVVPYSVVNRGSGNGCVEVEAAAMPGNDCMQSLRDTVLLSPPCGGVMWISWSR